jgi:hypothetical protein
LILDEAQNLGGNWPVHLTGAQTLEELEVGQWELSSEGVAVLAGMSQLRSICLRLPARQTVESIASLGTLERLRDLSLRQLTPYRDRQLLELTDAHLAALARLPHLVRLELDYSHILTPSGLAHLVGLPRLAMLNLNSNLWLTREGLAQLARLPALLTLDLGYLHSLGNQDLAPLASMVGLKRLSLRGCPNLSNVGLTPLRELKNLRSLDLTDCRGLTLQGVERLAEALPECRITHNAKKERGAREDPRHW